MEFPKASGTRLLSSENESQTIASQTGSKPYSAQQSAAATWWCAGVFDLLLIARAEVGNVAFLGFGEPPVEGSAVSSLISQIHAEPLKPLLNDVPQGTKDDRFLIRLKNKTPAEHVLV